MIIDRKKEEGLAPFMLVPVLFAGGISYLLCDNFDDDKSAGSVNGTPCVPGPGTRTVVDTGNLLSLSGGKMVESRTGNYDPRLLLDELARSAGRFMIAHVYLTNIGNRYRVGWGWECLRSVGADLRTTTNEIIGIVAATRDYYIAVVFKAVGAYFFMKDITSTPVWKLMWISFTNNNVNDNAIIYVDNAWGAGNNEHDLIRVPETTWLPTPLIYDTFTAGNGTSLDAHGSNTSGPDGQAADSLTGVEQSGDWDIQSNRANPDGAALHTWDLENADIVADLVVNGGAAGNPGLLFRFSDTNNYWYLQADRANNQLELHEVDGGVDTVRANAAVAINDSTDYTIRVICEAQTIMCWLNGLGKISYATATLNEGATKHGLYADHAACAFDNFQVFARK